MYILIVEKEKKRVFKISIIHHLREITYSTCDGAGLSGPHLM